MMKFSKEQLIHAVGTEYEWMCEEDGVQEGELTPDEYWKYLRKLSRAELFDEMLIDEGYIRDYMVYYGDVGIDEVNDYDVD